MNKLRDLWKQFGSIDHPAIFALSGDAQTKEEIAQKSGFATTTVSDIMLEHQRTGLFTRHSDRMKHNRVSWALAGELAYYASIEDAVANTLKYEKKRISFGYPVRNGRYMPPNGLVAHEVVAFLGLNELGSGSRGPHMSVLTLCGRAEETGMFRYRKEMHSNYDDCDACEYVREEMADPKSH